VLATKGYDYARFFLDFAEDRHELAIVNS